METYRSVLQSIQSSELALNPSVDGKYKFISLMEGQSQRLLIKVSAVACQIVMKHFLDNNYLHVALSNDCTVRSEEQNTHINLRSVLLDNTDRYAIDKAIASEHVLKLLFTG